MDSVVLVIHLILALAIIGLVLIQRSEGGGLGIGGSSGGGMGGFASARGTANALTKATTYLGAAFFVTSLTLAILAGTQKTPDDILEKLDAQPAAVESPLEVPVDGASETLEKNSENTVNQTSGPPEVPISN